MVDGAAIVEEDNGANIPYNLFQNFQPFFALYIIYRKLSYLLMIQSILDLQKNVYL